MRFVATILIFFIFNAQGICAERIVSSNAEAYKALNKLNAGDQLIFKNGEYKNIQLIIAKSGTENKKIIIKAKNPGKVFFTGDAKVELRGSYIVFEGFVFKNGNRNPENWKSHGPGLVAVYGSFNRITQCVFDNFDEAHSAWITTSLDEKGNVPTHCRIDHCSFTNKLTFDQVINLNNTPKKDTIGGPAMYHRVDHCFFSNPKKPGNAGGAIRIGYYRNDVGRCIIDSNLFVRQDSEPEIITGKSRENIYYVNTFLNCQGSLNFRHGDKQVAINNFFISTDSLYGYGGMFIWGSDHIIANNYFSLRKTIASRGSAAIYLNVGTKASEHALAYNSYLINNIFSNVNGYAIHFNPMIENRKIFAQQENKPLEFPRDIYLFNNIFYNTQFSSYPFFKDDYPDIIRNLNWKNNYYDGSSLGIKPTEGLEPDEMKTERLNDDFLLPITPGSINKYNNFKFYNIPFVDFDIQTKITEGLRGEPLSINEVLPGWMTAFTGNYFHTGILDKELKNILKKITQKNNQ